MTSLTIYQTPTASSTLTNAAKLVTGTGGGSQRQSSPLAAGTTGYGEVTSLGTSSAWAASGSIGSPTGKGWLWDVTTLEGQQISAGNWTPSLAISTDNATGTVTATIYCRAYKVNGSTYTLIGSMSLASQTLNQLQNQYTFSATSLSAMSFGTGDKLYIDVWLNITANSLSIASNIWGFTSDSGTSGNIIAEVTTPGYVTVAALSATMTGAGTLTGTTSRKIALAKTIVGAGTLTGTTSKKTALTTTFTGVAAFAGTTSRKTALSKTFIGAGTLTGTVSRNIPLAKTFTGVGTLAGTTSKKTALTTTFTGVGTLSPTEGERLALSKTFVGVGTLTGTASRKIALAKTFTGVGTFSPTISCKVAFSKTFTGVGTLSGFLRTNSSARFVGVGTLTGTASRKIALTTTSAGAGTLTGTTSKKTALSKTFVGVGTLTGTLRARSTTYEDRVLGDGPQAYYRLGEASGTTAYDSSGNGYDATLQGSFTLSQPGAISGETNTSIAFGPSGTLVIPSSLNISIWSAISVEFWINLAGAWQYTVITCDDSTTTTYINGYAVAEVPTSLIEFSSIFDFFGSYSAGVLDEVAIYNYALSSTQVSAHYHALVFPGKGTFVVASPTQKIALSTTIQGTGTLTYVQHVFFHGSGTISTTATLKTHLSTSIQGRGTLSATITIYLLIAVQMTGKGTLSNLFTYLSHILADHPRAYYRLDETSGIVAHDSSGNGYDAIIQGAVTYNQPSAIVGNMDASMSFSANAGLQLPSQLGVTSWSALSVEFWINVGSAWQHTVVTYDGSVVSYYTNGTRQTSVLSSTIEVSAIFDFFGSYLAGGLDEVAIYNYALTPSQISAHTPTTGAIALQTITIVLLPSANRRVGTTLSTNRRTATVPSISRR